MAPTLVKGRALFVKYYLDLLCRKESHIKNTEHANS